MRRWAWLGQPLAGRARPDEEVVPRRVVDPLYAAFRRMADRPSLPLPRYAQDALARYEREMGIGQRT